MVVVFNNGILSAVVFRQVVPFKYNIGNKTGFKLVDHIPGDPSVISTCKSSSKNVPSTKSKTKSVFVGFAISKVGYVIPNPFAMAAPRVLCKYSCVAQSIVIPCLSSKSIYSDGFEELKYIYAVGACWSHIKNVV